MQPDNKSLLAGKEEEVFPKLLEAARRCVGEDGADVIILGSTTMHQAHAYLADKLDVPVINPGPLSHRLAETALKLDLTHSRATYPAPLVAKTGNDPRHRKSRRCRREGSMKMARILVIVPFALDADGVANREKQQKYVQLDPDTELTYRPVTAGPTSFMSPHDWTLMDSGDLRSRT